MDSSSTRAHTRDADGAHPAGNSSAPQTAVHERVTLVATGRHHRAREPRSSARRIAVVLVVCGLLAVLGLGGVAALRLSNNLASSPLNLSDGAAAVADGPLDILVMGSDTRRGSGNREYGDAAESEGRTDVMMLVHVTEDRDAVSVVSFPRDLLVDIPRCTDPDTGTVYPAHHDMLNSAIENGGPGCTVATVDRLAGVSIDHFMLADFNAVKELSTTVGGVQVCVNQPVDDPKSGLKLPAGITSVEGDQALAFLRSRAAFGDGGDESRIRSQQAFLASLTRKIQADGTLNNLPQLYHIAEVMTQNLHVDDGLTSIPTLVSIARTFSGIDPARIAFVTVPTEPSPEDPNRLVLDEPAARKLFATLQQDRAVTDLSGGQDAPSGTPGPGRSATPDRAASPAPGATARPPAGGPAAPSPSDPEQESWRPAVPPATVPVRVSNHSGASHRAGELVRLLRDAGYTDAATRPADTELAGTEIHFATGWYAAAQDLAALLGIPEGQLVADDGVRGLELSVGRDFTSGDRLRLSGELPDEFQGQTAEQFTCRQ